jgi:hypothetical protein
MSAGAAGSTGAGAEGGGGNSKICKSLAPSRRSIQGNFNPGSPNVCPPRVMLNSNA